MRRGEVWWAVLRSPVGRRPVVVLTRNRALAVRQSVTVALVTTTARGIDVEIPLGMEEGLPKPCVVCADNLATVPKNFLTRAVGQLAEPKIRQLNDALKYALELD